MNWIIRIERIVGLTIFERLRCDLRTIILRCAIELESLIVNACYWTFKFE